MTAFTFSHIADAGDGLPALESCTFQRDQDTAFVQDPNRFYRWFASLVAVADGQFIVRPATLDNSEPGRWVRQGPPGTVVDPAKYEIPTDQAFDYTLGSRADLIAIAGGPVAGVFTLPEGSYAVTQSFALDADETMLVDGVVVEFRGFRGATILGNSATPLLTVDAGTFKGFGFVLSQSNTSSQTLALTGAAQLLLEQCRVLATGSSEAVAVGGSSEAHLVQTDLVGGPALAVLLGTARVTACNLNSLTAGPALTTQTGDIFMEDCSVNSITTGAAVSLVGGESYFSGNDFFADTADNVFEPGLGIVKVSGGSITGGGANVGMEVGNIESLVVQGTRFSALATGILGSGTPDKAVLDSLSMAATTGVDWPAANIPTNGLLEISIVQDSTTAFANHTEATARVNRKACTNAGALLAETAIVP